MRDIVRVGLLLTAAAMTTLFLAGCISMRAPVQPQAGLLFTSYKAPLSVNYDATPVCEKRGEAETLCVRDPIFTGLTVAWDKAGLDDAARAGGLTTVEYADYEYLSVFGVFGKFKVIAYGR